MGETESGFSLTRLIKKTLIGQGGDPNQSCGEHAIATTISALHLKATAMHPDSRVGSRLAQHLSEGDARKIGAPHLKLAKDLVRERAERSGVNTTVTPKDFR